MWVIYTDDSPLTFSTLDTDDAPEVVEPKKIFWAESTPILEGKMVDIINLCLIEAPPQDPSPDSPPDSPPESVP